MRGRRGLGRPVRREVRRLDAGGGPEAVKKAVKPGEFKDYSIRCEGKHVTVKLNGETMVDSEFEKMPEEGVIARQLHRGPVTEIQVRDIRFRELAK